MRMPRLAPGHLGEPPVHRGSEFLVVRSRIGKVFRRLAIQITDQLLRRRWYGHSTLKDDRFSLYFPVVDFLVGVIVGPHGRAFQRDAREQTASTRITQYFGAQGDIS